MPPAAFVACYWVMCAVKMLPITVPFHSPWHLAPVVERVLGDLARPYCYYCVVYDNARVHSGGPDPTTDGDARDEAEPLQ
eukprot:2758822-Pyramimonas_sp.AAC.2